MFNTQEIKMIRTYFVETREQLMDDLNSHEYKDNREDAAAIVNEIRKCNDIIHKCDNYLED